MLKKVKYSYKGMNQDLLKSKHPFDFYYSANNIRITATDSQTTAGLHNEKGNELKITLPSPCIEIENKLIRYGDKILRFKNTELAEQLTETASECEEDSSISPCSEIQQIIGHSLTRDSLLLFSTDSKGFDCIWEVTGILEENFDLNLLYCRNIGFSIDNPIQALFNYENAIIQKVYWVDGNNQMRFINIKHSIANGDLEELIDINSTNIDMVGIYDLSQPQILDISQGGNHTAGMIQYTYNLYKLNGAQTGIAPLSELVALDNGALGGGDINQDVGASPFIEITNIDPNYTHIRIYGVKYAEFGVEPAIALIVDQEIDNYNSVKYFDNGSTIQSVSLAEFLFLGSSLIIPQHIESKDNRLLMANIKEQPFIFDLDCRAYAHDAGGLVKIWNNVTASIGGDGSIIPSGTASYPTGPLYNVLDSVDAVNPDYETYKFQADGVTFGGEGRYIKYELTQTPLADLEGDLKNTRFFKDDEIYRLGIQFYNIYGQKSLPIWITDFKSLSGNLLQTYNTINVELKPEFYTYLDELCTDIKFKPIGYKIIRAERTEQDKTIVTQGFLSSMCTQYVGRGGRTLVNYGVTDTGTILIPNTPSNPPTDVTLPQIQTQMDLLVKRPQLMHKNMTALRSVSGLQHGWNMGTYGASGVYNRDDNEIHTDYRDNLHQTWQYTKMMQLFSPEVTFNKGLSFGGAIKLRIKGITEKLRSGVIGETIRVSSSAVTRSVTREQAAMTRDDGTSQAGWVGGPRDGDKGETTVTNRKMHYHEGGTFNPVITDADVNIYDIFGAPELTTRGQAITSYNGQGYLKYYNSLTAFITDPFVGKRSNYDEVRTVSINTDGNPCVTIVPGADTLDMVQRPGLEDIWTNTGLAGTVPEGIVIGELAYPESYRYTGNIYGGITNEAKSKTSYIAIGQYNKIDVSTSFIESPGDMFVQVTKLARLSKGDTEIVKSNVYQLTDTVECVLESTVNSQNRKDLSLQEWTVKSQPRYDEYHNYNRVYSQGANLVQNKALNFKFKAVQDFDTRVIISKVKVPGEIIDSFTDFLENELLDLDGKYGAINSLINHRDSIYSLQDKGVAKLIINPRTLIQDEDGVDLELGTGNVLHDYTYMSTTSGTINKWSVVNSPTGFYYLDVLNKAWNKFSGGNVANLTDGNGMSSYFFNNIDYKTLKFNNPLLKKGANGGYNFINNNSYLTVHDKDRSFTLNYNETSNSFESFHDYLPSMYMSSGDRMFTTSPDLNKVYEQDAGEYQRFYEEYYPSFVILQINPEADLDCVFNTIEYKSEMYLNDLDQPERTLSHITAWNEYQATNRIPLELGRNKNLRRKFRNWQANIPRQAGSRDRIRNPWIFLKLELDQKDNLKMILHDVLVHYSAQ